MYGVNRGIIGYVTTLGEGEFEWIILQIWRNWLI